MLRSLLFSFCLTVLALPATAQKFAEPSGLSSSKFSVQGSTLIYNSNDVSGDAYPEIDGPDVDELRAQLRRNRNINTLQLTSTGGLVWAGDEMARVVLDYGLNTRVVDECSSSCVMVFLAGAEREMTGGSKIGFHQNSWGASGAQSYFKEWRQSEGWDTPFDFASWLYQDTQHETAAQLEFMISRGVDPGFAIETKKYRPVMWFPTRDELRDAGVINR
ncbi:MAG: hypothetical protein AAFU41_06415 [Pseudomonadota bacterium]